MLDESMTGLRACAQRFPDLRKGGNHEKDTLRDACLSACGVFFTQLPSFLAYQGETRLRQRRDDAESLFGVAAIPSDNEIGNVADPVPPSQVGKLYWEALAAYQGRGLLAEHCGFAGQWLCAWDGVQHFGSNRIPLRALSR